MELIRLENITKTYHLGEIDVPVLHDISLSIQGGELVALVGASGSGKTTLMNILGCLDRPSGGRFWLDGEEMSRLRPDQRAVVRSRKLGFVFQNFNLLARTSAFENVLMPLDYAVRRPSEREADARATDLLNRVGLADRMEHESSQMSGGQQQRVALARSLINHPPLLLADEPTGNLDSKTSAEILDLFDQLHDEGITIILVTHNPEIAERASRVIRLADGRIASDTTNPPRTKAGPIAADPTSGGSVEATEGGEKPASDDPKTRPGADDRANPPPSPAQPKIKRRHRRRLLAALFPPTVRTALGALRRNKMRSALTTLGIIIGVGAVIAMMEIGQGARTAMQQSIASMGANNLLVMPGAASSGGVSFGSGSVTTLSPSDADEIAQQCSAVKEVAPVVRARTQVVFGNRNWVPASIYGTTPDFLGVREWEELEEGDAFGMRDVRNGSKVCMVGQTLVRELFQGESPVGKEVRIQNVSFRVIGVLRRKGANMMGMDQDDIVLAPWTTIKFRVAGTSLANVNQSAGSSGSSSDTSQRINSLNALYPGSTALYPVPSPAQQANNPQPVHFVNVDQILVKAASSEEIPTAIKQITDLLRERHHIQPGQLDDFNIRDMTEMTKVMASQASLMGGLLLVVALISLVVGGVGIMNIMLVSVTERTREIGLRMAVGARAPHILRQFLVEAVALCLLGGAVGIAAGRSASWAVTAVLRWPTETSLPAILAAVAVSVSVGVVFGYYPAWKASRLDPIEALRYE